MREEKVGISSLPTDITLRLPEAEGGEGSSWRGRRGGGSSSGTLVAASARDAWCAAIVFVEIQWYSMVLGSDTEQHSQLLQSFAYITVNMSNVCATFGI